MSSRVAVAFAVLSLVAVNTVLLVLGDVKPGCTQYRYVFEPDLCPITPVSVDCSIYMPRYTTEKQWIKREDGPPYFGKWIHSTQNVGKEVDFCVATGALCGGIYKDRFFGYFMNQQTPDPTLFAIQDGTAECYNEYNCYWDDSDYYGNTNFFTAWLWNNFKVGDTTHQFATEHTIAQQWCKPTLVSVSPAILPTWRDAYWVECFEMY